MYTNYQGSSLLWSGSGNLSWIWEYEFFKSSDVTSLFVGEPY